MAGTVTLLQVLNETADHPTFLWTLVSVKNETRQFPVAVTFVYSTVCGVNPNGDQISNLLSHDSRFARLTLVVPILIRFGGCASCRTQQHSCADVVDTGQKGFDVGSAHRDSNSIFVKRRNTRSNEHKSKTEDTGHAPFTTFTPRNDAMPSPTELRQTITQTIIDALTSGNELPPWRKPFSSDTNAPGLHTSLSSSKPYRGINQLLLMVAAMKNNFSSKWWATFHQIKQQGGSVLKGSKSTVVVLYRPIDRTKTDDNGNEVDDSFFMMKSFRVFNADQTTLEQFQVSEPDESGVPFERYEHADELIDAVGADIRYGGGQAFYNLREDFIQLPHRNRFDSSEAFYETSFHEHVHYTEHESRLNWDRKNEGYAMGELIAEMGACFLMAELGLPISDQNNHASYLKHWLRGMEGDPKFIFKASSQASKAVEWLKGCGKQEVAAEKREPAIVV